MAVSKRLRYEILRRDNFTCRYCNRTDAPLRVDHVVPVALGGTDEPTNLVTSCEPCNSGKTSTVPDSPLVAQVREDAMRWQMAWAVAVAEAETEGKQRAKDIAKVKKNYVAAYKGRHGTAPVLPEGWEASVGRWLDLGLPMTLIDKAIASAVGRSYVPAKDRFAYFAGCCWSLLKELKDRTEQIVKKDSPGDDEEEFDEYSLLDHVEEAFAHGWDPKEQPNSYTRRMLAAYTEAASAAGYERSTIEHAAYRAACEGHADLSVHLKTIDNILEVAAEPHEDSPYGSLRIDADLLPDDDERVSWLVADTAVAIWRKAWRDAMNGTPPSIYSPEVQAVREAACSAYRKTEDAEHVLRGAAWAGADGHADLTRASDEAEAHSVTEPAISAWGLGYHAMTGSQAPGPVHDKVWEDLYTLHAGKSWDPQIIAAAAFAGVHGTTRLHFGLDPEEAKKLGVDPYTQLLEDFWAQAWFGSQRPLEWPTEDQRAEFQAHVARLREQENGLLPSPTVCVRAGMYRETNPEGHYCKSLTDMLKQLEVSA